MQLGEIAQPAHPRYEVSRRRRSRQRGSAVAEFALCVFLFWIPLFVGATQFGFQLIQGIQVDSLCRDSGHMYAYTVDFSQSSNQYMLASIASSLNVDPTGAGGSTVVILSTVHYVSLADCQAGGYSSTCPNYQQVVFTNQITVGNPSIHASAFGNPTTASNGDVAAGSSSSSGYLNDASTLVSGYSGITLSTSSTGQQTAYIAETYSQAKGFNWFRSSGWVNAVFYF